MSPPPRFYFILFYLFRRHCAHLRIESSTSPVSLFEETCCLYISIFFVFCVLLQRPPNENMAKRVKSTLFRNLFISTVFAFFAFSFPPVLQMRIVNYKLRQSAKNYRAFFVETCIYIYCFFFAFLRSPSPPSKCQMKIVNDGKA